MITVRDKVNIFIVKSYRLIYAAIDCVNVEEPNAFRVTVVRAFFTNLEVINLFIDCGATWKFIVAMRRPR